MAALTPKRLDGYDYATFDAGREAAGTRLLWNVIASLWPGAKLLGIYARRNIRGSDKLSLHAEGRAVDVMPSAGDRDAIAEWAVSNALTYGIQEVIVYETKRIWTSKRRSEGWRPYSGVSSGYHHVHIGQNRAGAKLTDVGKPDPLVLASSASDVLAEYGVRLWQFAAAGAMIAAGLTYKNIRRQHR